MMNNELYNILLKQTLGVNNNNKVETIIQDIESRLSSLENNFDTFMGAIQSYLQKQNEHLNLWRNNFLQKVETHIVKINDELEIWKQESTTNQQKFINNKIDEITISDKQSDQLNLWKSNLTQKIDAYIEKIDNEFKSWKQKTVIEQQNLIDNKIADITVQNIDKYSVKVDTHTDKEINGLFRLKEISGNGYIKQLMIKTSSTDYTIYISIDDRLLFEKPYTYFSNYSDYLSNLSAFDDGGYYYFSIRNLDFQERLIINIKTDSAITFDEILLKYNIRDENYL